MNQNKLKKEENKKTLWSQSNKTYVRDRQANSVGPTLSRHRLITAYKIIAGPVQCILDINIFRGKTDKTFMGNVYLNKAGLS